MNTIDTPEAADYTLNGAGRVVLNDAGSAVVAAFRQAETAYDTLQQSWAGACLASLFLRHPWLQSLRITLSASAEYNDQGGSYRSVSNSVTQVLAVAEASLPDSLVDEGVFDDISAISEIEQDLEDFDHDLYLSISNAPDEYGDLVFDLNRSAIALLLQAGTVSGAKAYRAWFPTPADNAAPA
ncbi:MAG: hypothetical protein KGK18_19150 [Burkholderiales bacterium]|nr:hypothetical protein [Burkholderiales bacterium]